MLLLSLFLQYVCHAVLDWRNVDQTVFFVGTFGYVFQLHESWHKIDGRHLGQDCSLGVHSFSISHPFFFVPPCWNLQVASGSGTQLILLQIIHFQSRWPPRCAQALNPSLIQFHRHFSLLQIFACSWHFPRCNSPCWQISAQFFRIPIHCVSDFAQILLRPSNVLTILWPGPHHMLNHLLATPSRSTCCFASGSHR